MLDFFLDWFLTGIYLLLYIFIGWFGIRKKVIPLKIAEWSVVVVLLARIIDYAARAWWGVLVSYPNETGTIGNFMARALLRNGAYNSFVTFVTITAIAAGLWLILAYIVHKTNSRYIDMPDAILLSLGVIIAGWPYFIVYLFLVFAFTLLGYLSVAIVKKGKVPRMPITPFFVLAGIVTVLWGVKIAQLTGLYVLR